MQNLQQGQLTFSWDAPAGYATRGEELFSLTIKGKLAADQLSMTSDITRAEVYTQDGGILSADLVVMENEEVDAGFSLLQNAPNPFQFNTQISFFLPEDGKVSVSIYDLGGKEIFNTTSQYLKGLNAITVDRNDVSASGIYYYKVSYGDLNETKKMIIMD